MITLFFWLMKMIVLFPIMMLYWGIRVVFFPIFWLLDKPKEKEYWIWF